MIKRGIYILAAITSMERILVRAQARQVVVIGEPIDVPTQGFVELVQGPSGIQVITEGSGSAVGSGTVSSGVVSSGAVSSGNAMPTISAVAPTPEQVFGGQSSANPVVPMVTSQQYASSNAMQVPENFVAVAPGPQGTTTSAPTTPQGTPAAGKKDCEKKESSSTSSAKKSTGPSRDRKKSGVRSYAVAGALGVVILSAFAM